MTTLSLADSRLSSVAAARYLGVHPQTLHRWRREGTGPTHIRLGPGKIVYEIADLRAWLERRTVPGL